MTPSSFPRSRISNQTRVIHTRRQRTSHTRHPTRSERRSDRSPKVGLVTRRRTCDQPNQANASRPHRVGWFEHAAGAVSLHECRGHASAGRPDPGQCRDQPDGLRARACERRRPSSSRRTCRPGPVSSRHREERGHTADAFCGRDRWTEQSATRCRSTRLRTLGDADRCNRPSAMWAVEFRREESRRRLENRRNQPVAARTCV
jgi:hypothetical protein